MHEESDIATNERRRAERKAFPGGLRVRIAAAELEGHSGNVSKSGVYFVTEGEIEVLLHIEGRDEPLKGTLVRASEMRSGELGVAVRLEPGELETS